jgi:hypothetical protein
MERTCHETVRHDSFVDRKPPVVAIRRQSIRSSGTGANMSFTTRRGFVTAAAAGAAGVAAVGRAADPAAAIPGMCTEPAREVPLTADADVIVCGAGPAGVTAAITAARAGAGYAQVGQWHLGKRQPSGRIMRSNSRDRSEWMPRRAKPSWPSSGRCSRPHHARRRAAACLARTFAAGIRPALSRCRLEGTGNRLPPRSCEEFLDRIGAELGEERVDRHEPHAVRGWNSFLL